MENQQFTKEDEIDLREYIKVIIKRKKLIISLFSIAVIIAAVSSMMTPKVYKATATIMATPSTMQGALFPLVLQRTIVKLNLKDASGRAVTAEDLSRKLNVKKDGENAVQLEVTDTNPQEARDIANTWAQQFVEYSKDLLLKEVNGNEDSEMTQFEVSKKNLLAAEKKVNDFKKGYKQDLMSAELTMKKNMLIDYEKELVGMGVELQTKEYTLLELKKQIAVQKEFIIVSKSITDDSLWQASTKVDGLSGLDKKGLRSELINPIYQDLESRILNGEVELNTLKAREEYLNKAIGSLTEDINQLDGDINQKDFDLSGLTSQVDILKKSYDDQSSKIEDARIAKAGEFGELRIVSPANIPSHPVGQGRMKRVALVGILSLILGVFLAFFMEFWQKGK